MGYYNAPMGDYSTYGYGQGDPGFLSGLWKGFKKIARFIPGPIGAIATAVGGAAVLTKMTPPIMQPRAGAPMTPGGLAYYGSRPPGGLPMGTGRRLTGPVGAVSADGCPPRGYHFAKDGSGRVVRNRRMNIANPRALRRAMRRVQGFEKLAKRTISFTRRVKMKK